MEVLQVHQLNEVINNMKAELTALDTGTVEVEWLCELLMDLSVVENLYRLFL